MKRGGCACCGEKIDKRRDRLVLPYCSFVSRTLGRAGLGWRLNPYRIVDPQSGIVLSTGPHFDLTANGLVQLRKKAEHLRGPRPGLAVLDPSESMTLHVPEQNRCLEPAMTGSRL